MNTKRVTISHFLTCLFLTSFPTKAHIRTLKGIEDYENHRVSEKAREFSKTLKLMMANYDRRIPPFQRFSGPLKIKSTVTITAFGPVSDVDMDFTTSMFFRQSWNDPRLKLPSDFKQDKIRLNHHMTEQLWTPDAFFLNIGFRGEEAVSFL